MKEITITKQQSGKRIDKFLASSFAKASSDKGEFFYSRGEIIRKVKNEEVLVNGKRVKPSYVLEEGDEIGLKNFSKEKKEGLFENIKISLEILFEDENIVLINKQAGIQVHPSSNEKANTIVNALIFKFPEIKNVHDDSKEGNFRPGIVHRLDKDTSGVMVIAKNLKSFADLKKLFKERLVEKKYIAICKGIFKEKEGLIEKPVARSSSYRKQVIARKNTKTTVREAVTAYKVLEQRNGYSLVEAMPKTGRMHQIRIHLASIEHPVIGDLVYADKKHKEKHRGLDDAKKIEKTAKRQLLHAREIKFTLFGKKYDFLAPIPQDFKDFLTGI